MLACCAALFSLSLPAQIEKGTWMIGGSGSGGFSSQSFKLYLQPTIGYFPVTNLALGLRPRFGMAAHSRLSSWSLGSDIYARYYFPLSQSIYLFPEMSIGYGQSTSFYRNEQTISQSLGGSAALGFGTWITDNVAFETQLGYGLFNQSSLSGFQSNGLNFSMGLQVYLGRGKR